MIFLQGGPKFEVTPLGHLTFSKMRKYATRSVVGRWSSVGRQYSVTLPYTDVISYTFFSRTYRSSARGVKIPNSRIGLQ